MRPWQQQMRHMNAWNLCAWAWLAIATSVGALAAQTVAPPASRPAAPSVASQPATRPDSFTLATFNVNNGIGQMNGTDQQRRDQLDAVVDAIKKCDADVVALQEGNDLVYGHLSKSLEKTYPHMIFYSAQAAGGSGWLSKTPLLDLKVLPALVEAGGWFRTPIASVRFQNRVVLLANVHLHPTIPNGSGLRAMLASYAQTEKIRAAEIGFIWGKIEQERKTAKVELPVVIMGDFNAPSQLAAGSFLRDKGMIDSFAATNDQPDSHPSWQSKPDGQGLSFRIDLIWHNSQMAALNSRIVASDVSDHKPVVSQLHFAPKAATVPAGGATESAGTKKADGTK